MSKPFDIDNVMQADVHRLHGLARDARRRAQYERLLEESMARVEARRAALPKPTFPEELPVSQRLEEIAAALEKHQVIVVCGETGSGKSTQLPKLMLALGRGTRGLIAHTQPRRVAARAIARRLSEELGTEPGREVGFKIRFSDHVSKDSYIKVLTDGMLLAEAQGDRFLDQYDTIIIDEAHERSLNIDFLLGYLKRLLPRRPDLKVIITSATIDPESFSRHFDDAPIVLVSGRTYPVEVRYRPLRGEDEDARDRSQVEAILDAVDECWKEGPGDVLVFLAGEREIRETAEALRKRHPPGVEILPLFSRLSAAEQDRVFNPGHARRIVLATNVAETSITVPRIRYVVDPGMARLSRYSWRSKVQRLPIEKISQASANQRKGRCGRIAEGICIRLYAEDDFLSRPEYTDPEIHRTNLAAVILQMQLLKLGDIESFPFLDPPDTRFVNDGYRLLQELQALDSERRITELGRRIARLPMDPRLARMLLAGADEHCLDEMLVITTALTLQDPRERPLDQQQAADEAHAQFDDENSRGRSDFLVLLNLWKRFHEERRHRSGSQLRKWCKENFLSYLRMREWHDTYKQVKALLAEQGMKFSETEIEPRELYPRIHRAVLAGCLGQVGMKEEEQLFRGPRGLKFQVWPGSTLARTPPKWLVAAEFVETQKVWARTAALIQPGWVEQVAGHLVTREYGEPAWHRDSGRVTAAETVSLFGLPLVSGRRVDYGRIDPAAAREIFIRDALVPGEIDGQYGFLEHNLALVQEIEALEARVRRRDILVDESLLARFYDERLPTEIHDGITLRNWYRRHRAEAERMLRADREFLLARSPDEVTGERYPAALDVNGIPMALDYRFAPGGELDGLILEVPVELIGQVCAQRTDWLVPGYIEEKATAMIRALPKALRRNFVPAPEFARAAVEAMSFGEGDLREALARQLTRMAGMVVEAEVFSGIELPPHLVMKYRVVDAEGRELAVGGNLAELQERFAAQATKQVRGLETAAWPEIEATDWTFGAMPEHVEINRGGRNIRAYPALADREFRVAAVLSATAEEARRSTHRALIRLLELTCRDAVKFARKNIPGFHETCLRYKTVPGSGGNCEDLREDIVRAALERAAGEGLASVRSEQGFRELQETVRLGLQGEVNALGELIAEVMNAHHAIRRQLGGRLPPAMLVAVKDIDAQLRLLVRPGFVRATPVEWLRHLPRYLQAVLLRMERAPNNPGKDRNAMAQLQPSLERLQELASREDFDALLKAVPELAQWRWMIEEFRVSLFAQELKTALPVSAQRLEEQWKLARKALRSG
ncbi:MAG TPA: ATP-dependent RNA helicase HrpA [Gammaproteobacteria bacterium]|nr:ATP-dependent RNA helicase HrpA [Gammaproteobacteria bacterium]